VDSTNARARTHAGGGAPHGSLVTATAQTAGRGRQGRAWVVPAGRALAMSLVLRDWPRLLPLAAGVAVAEEAGPEAQIKWPNDVLLDGRKVAGILVEGRPQEGWMVLGIGLNVAVEAEDLPDELRGIAGGLGRHLAEVEPTLESLLERVAVWLTADADQILAVVRERDALAGQEISWSDGSGRGAGIDDSGRLLVDGAGGRRALEAGEVHLAAARG
jgi:BirA family biotin operon repressor/biotin-[acetyl-CoA-carboxylase] ligase